VSVKFAMPGRPLRRMPCPSPKSLRWLVTTVGVSIVRDLHYSHRLEVELSSKAYNGHKEKKKDTSGFIRFLCSKDQKFNLSYRED